MSDSLVVLDQVQQKLATIKTVDEAKEIRDQADALAHYARRAQKGLAVQNRCAWVKLLAERRAGELLRDIPRAPIGGAQSGRGEKHSHTFGECLDRLGIHWDTAKRWQRLAKLPEAELTRLLTECDAEQEELTSAKVDTVMRACEAAAAREASDDVHDGYKEVFQTYVALCSAISHYLTPGLKEDQLMSLVLADRQRLHRYEIEKLRSYFLDLRHRVNRFIEGLTQRMALEPDSDPAEQPDNDEVARLLAEPATASVGAEG